LGGRSKRARRRRLLPDFADADVRGARRARGQHHLLRRFVSGQIATGWTGRALAGGTNGLSLRTLFALSIVGGAIGAVILLITPAVIFARLVPWLCCSRRWCSPGELFSQERRRGEAYRLLRSRFGSVLDLDLRRLFWRRHRLSDGRGANLRGSGARVASATKNVLAGVMNASAVLIFLFSPDLHWHERWRLRSARSSAACSALARCITSTKNCCGS